MGWQTVVIQIIALCKRKKIFELFSNWATTATGSSAAFMIAGLSIVAWTLLDLVANYSQERQLVIITDTTIITSCLST